MPRPRPAFMLYPRPERWIFNALKVKDPPRRMAKTPETLKKISFPRILRLMRHQVRPNSHQHSPKKTRTVVFIKENPNNKAKARILLLLASTPPLSGKTRTKIRIRKTYPVLSVTIVSKKIIIPANIPRRSQKLASILTTSTLITEDSEEAILVSAKELEQVTYIRYLIAFPGGITQDSSALDPVLVLLDSDSEVNAMHPVFVERLGLVVQTTNVGAQKIDGITLDTYKMVVAAFSVTN